MDQSQVQLMKTQLQLVKYGLLMRYLLGVLETFKAHGICPLCHMFMVGVSVLPCGHCYCSLCIKASQDIQKVKCPICHSQGSIERNGMSTSRLYAIEAVIEDFYLALSTVYANLKGQQLPHPFANTNIFATAEINPDFWKSQIQQFLNNQAKPILTAQTVRNSFLDAMWTNSRNELLKLKRGFRERFGIILNLNYGAIVRLIICHFLTILTARFLLLPSGVRKIVNFIIELPWMDIAKSSPQILLTAGIGCYFYYVVLTGQRLPDIWGTFRLLWKTQHENLDVDEEEAEEARDYAEMLGRVKSWNEIRNFLYYDFGEAENRTADIGSEKE